MNITIYALINPTTREIFYIGYTGKTLEQRLKAHYLKVYEAKRGEINWNKRLEYLENLLPLKAEIHQLDICDESIKDKVEQKYIEYYKRLNPNLTNQTTGGIGGNTFEGLSEIGKLKTGAKISEALKGKPKPDGFSKNLSDTRKGYGNPAAGKTKYEPLCIETKENIVIFKNSIECNCYFNNKNAWSNLIKVAQLNSKRALFGSITKTKKEEYITFPKDCKPRIKDIVQSLLEREGNSFLYDKRTKEVTVNLTAR